MNQPAIARRLLSMDIGLRICFGAFVLVAAGIAVFQMVRVGPLDPLLVDFGLLGVLTISALFNFQRFKDPFSLALPVSTRALFLTSLAAALVSIWIPVLTAEFVTRHRHHWYLVPMDLGVLWTAGHCFLCLLKVRSRVVSYPESGGLMSVAQLAVLLLLSLYWMLLHSPERSVMAGLVAFSFAACIVILLRLPPVFEIADADRPILFRGLLWSSENDWWLVARLWLPSVWSLLFVFSASWGSWVIRGFWIMLLYVQSHRDESFAMTLPISPLRLVYVRLATAGALVFAALFLNPLVRLFHRPVQFPGLVDSLLTVAAGLVMVVTVKLIRWHRLRRIPRRVIALAPVLLFFVAATSIWPNYVTSALASWRPEQAVPALVGVIALMLWLMAVETRETDYFAVPLGGRER